MSKMIHLSEDGGHDWRRAYADMVDRLRTFYRLARTSGDFTPRYIGGKTYVPKDCSDAQLEELVQGMAERALNRAIIEQRIAEPRRKARKGQGL